MALGAAASMDDSEKLVRSDANKTGFKGVYQTREGGRYYAHCYSPPCNGNRLGTFGTPEEAAQA